jgi:hypothetical protein
MAAPSRSDFMQRGRRSGVPSSSMQFKTWTATATSVEAPRAQQLRTCRAIPYFFAPSLPRESVAHDVP